MRFRDDYAFLSNMYPCKVVVNIEGTEHCFTCAEAAFQAYKCPERAREFESMDGRTAKAAGRRVPLREDWNEIRDDVMREVLVSKFSDPVLRAKLQAVDYEICEDNTWNDTYWGRCNGRGQNKLGQLLMEIRDRDQFETSVQKNVSRDASEFGF